MSEPTLNNSRTYKHPAAYERDRMSARARIQDLIDQAVASVHPSAYTGARHFLATQIATICRDHCHNSSVFKNTDPAAAVLIQFIDDDSVRMHLAGSFIEHLRKKHPLIFENEQLMKHIYDYYDELDIVPDDTFSEFWLYDPDRYSTAEIEVKIRYCEVFFRNASWQLLRREPVSSEYA